MNIVTIVGARPQFVKAAMVSRVISATPDIHEVLVHTGQHYDWEMSGIFFRELEIRAPDHYLNVGSAAHGVQTGAMLARIEELLQRKCPDWVVVYGDTNSTLAGALAAVKMHTRVAHVEAGLRSFNRCMPEEINRVLTDHAADLLFAPTETAMRNLASENLQQRAVRCGDVMYDAALHYSEVAEQRSDFLARYGLAPNQYCLATIHRAGSTDDPNKLRAILAGLAEVSFGLPVILPLHPRTRAALAQFGMQRYSPASLRLVDPLGYLDMIMAEKNARLIATDSGGVQKEAYFFRVPCVTLRTESEWVELTEHGYNFLAGTESAAIVSTVERALATAPACNARLYGDGHAADHIVTELIARAPRSALLIPRRATRSSSSSARK